MGIDRLAQALADEYLAPIPLHRLDWRYLWYILNDEVRWGTRGELNSPNSSVLQAFFDNRGDANKFRRLAIRSGYVVMGVEVADVTPYPGIDYIVTITGRRW